MRARTGIMAWVVMGLLVHGPFARAAELIDDADPVLPKEHATTGQPLPPNALYLDQPGTATAPDLVTGVSPAPASEPLLIPFANNETAGTVSNEGAGAGAIVHGTSCDFDAYQYMAESKCRARSRPLRDRPHGLWNLFHGNGSGSNPDPDNGYCDFECANCYGRIDVEKRLIFSFAAGNGQGRATRAAYGDDYSGQVGAEFLPCVIMDGSETYVRGGFTTMFNYSNFVGNRQNAMQSLRSNTQVTIDDGKSYGFVIGPTVRADFECFHIRMSPNATIAAAFDWTGLTGVSPRGTDVVRIDQFKFSGFDVGGYIRAMMDFPITQYTNIGVGMEYRFIPTDVMMMDNDYRKHLGIVIGLTQEF